MISVTGILALVATWLGSVAPPDRRPPAPDPRPQLGARGRLGSKLRVLTMLLLASGCATSIRGTTQKLVITSEPSGAAVLADGVPVGATPAIIALSRRRAHSISVVADGHLPQAQVVSSTADVAPLAGNLLLLHPAVVLPAIGMDLLGGAHRRLNPAALNFRLERDGSAAGLPVPVRWQPAPFGSRIRVVTHSPNPCTIGTLVDMSGDTLLLDHSARVAGLRMVRDSVATVEVSLGADRDAGFYRGMVVGALVGVVAGFVGGALSDSGDASTGLFFAGLLGLPVGGGIGGIVGSAFPKEKWVRVH